MNHDYLSVSQLWLQPSGKAHLVVVGDGAERVHALALAQAAWRLASGVRRGGGHVRQGWGLEMTALAAGSVSRLGEKPLN